MKLGFGFKQFGDETFLIFDGSIVNVNKVQRLHIVNTDEHCYVKVHYANGDYSDHFPVGENDGMQFVLGEVDTPTEAMVREMNTPREAS